MDISSFLTLLVSGCLSGVIASLVFPRGGLGFIGNCLVCTAGGFISYYIFKTLGPSAGIGFGIAGLPLFLFVFIYVAARLLRKDT